ncbi:MAG TPA: ABC transporter substrate-binding protein [Candidatus Limnocylindria bacterium]|nr:ABC transporter substrate-binding protein [Candidatus Limnocylindria bacterium]
MTRPSPRVHPLLAVIAAGVLIAACQAPAGEGSESASASIAASASASASEAAACDMADLPTKAPGVLTVGTDNPAFPPYFSDATQTDPWEFGDPTNGEGFESAVAYALAEQLGFTEDQVTWVAVPFNNSIAPGPKDFDVYLAQVSYTAERAQVVDLSEGYFFSNQALVTTAGSPLADATTIEEVAGAQLGAAGNTTSLSYITDTIQPVAEPRVYDDNTGAKSALEAGQVDGVVFDLATAFYIVNVEMDDGVVVGQLPSDPEDKEHFSFVLDLDSPLTACVDEALLTMGENGELDSIAQEWLADYVDAPFIRE